MKKLIYITFIGLLGLLYSCEKDGDQIFMLENPAAPTIVSMPDLTLERNNGTDILEFPITPVDPGFVASAQYFLEACATGDDFANVIPILNQNLPETFEITVADLNGLLLKKFPADEASSVDFRVRASLVVDGGTGAPGTSDDSFVYNSAIETASVTLYGLPKLDLLNSGMEQKIESPLGNGDYTGTVKLDVTMPFTLNDPDAGVNYGGSGGTLTVDGSGIVVEETGWYILNANTNDLSYTTTPEFVGLVGSATPNGWDAPDSKMDYDVKGDFWYITIDLVEGFIKFRKNDGWAWNMGFVEGETPGMSGNTQQGGVGNDIPINEAGNYTVKFVILSDDAGTYEIIKN